MDAVAEALALLAAALAAGVVNAVAGGGSLITFPTLVAVGLSPVAANVTNAVAVLPGYVGGSIAYREELAAQRDQAVRLSALAALGAAGGAALLLVLPADVFEAVAPWLVMASALALLARPVRKRRRGAAGAAVLGASVYGGYFGAGLGFILLATLSRFTAEDLQRLNALKSVLSLVTGVVAAAAFAIFGPVAWDAAALMAAASFAGGHAGVSVARRVPESRLRWAMALVGLAAGLALLLA